MFSRPASPFLVAMAATVPDGLAQATHATTLGTDVAEKGAPGLVKLMPAGSFAGRDGRGPYDAGDLAAMQAVVDATLQRAGATELVVDYDHQSVFAAVPGVGGTAPAAGWIRRLEARADGIWAEIAWTEAAQARIRAGEYRYISPVYLYDKAGKVRVITCAGLTNTPNLDLAGAVAARAMPGASNPMDKILAALGLPADAGEAGAITAIQRALAAETALSTIATAVGVASGAAADAVVAAVQSQAAAGGAPDPAKFVPVAQVAAMAQELASLKAGQTATEATRMVEAAMAAGKLPPALKPWALDLAAKDRPAFETFMSAMPAVVTVGGSGAAAGAPPASGGGLSEADRAVMSAMGLSEEAFKKSRKAEEMPS